MLIMNEISVFALGFILVALLCGGVYLWKAMRWFINKPHRQHVILGDDMRGRQAFVEEISPCGQYCFVTVGAERWRAQMSAAKRVELKTGDIVNVKGVNGLTLNVCPDKNN